MDSLNKYSFDEFMCLPQEEKELYKAFGLKVRPDDWGKGDILEWEWAVIKQLQDILNQPSLSYNDMTEVILIASGLPVKEICVKPWYEVFRLYNFIITGVKQINEIEKQLEYEPDAREVNAGIEEYNQYSWFVTLDRLAGGDMLKYDAIGKLKYCDVFAKLKLNKTDAQYSKRLMKQNNV